MKKILSIALLFISVASFGQNGFVGNNSTRNMTVFDTLKTPNIIQKSIDTSNYKIAVVGPNGSHYKMYWPVFGSSYSADETTLHLSGTTFSVKSTYDATLMHLAGTETITGTKTFSGPTAVTGGFYLDMTSPLTTSASVTAGKAFVILNTSTAGQTLTLNSPGAGGFKTISNLGSADWSVASSFGTVKDASGATVSTLSANTIYYTYGDGSNWIITKIGGSATTPTSGVYQPTVSNTTNVSASTTYVNTGYSRVGNQVYVNGKVSVTPTATGTVLFRIDLPISTGTFSDEDMAAGGMFPDNPDNATVGRIAALVSGSAVIFKYKALTTSATDFSFSFSYTYQAP